MSPCWSEPPAHSTRSSQSTELNSLSFTPAFVLDSYFTHGSVCISMLLPPFILPSSSPTVSRVCSRRLPLYSWPAYRLISTIFLATPHPHRFSRFHIYELIYDIGFSHSDLLHSVFIHLTTTDSTLFLFIKEQINNWKNEDVVLCVLAASRCSVHQFPKSEISKEEKDSYRQTWRRKIPPGRNWILKPKRLVSLHWQVFRVHFWSLDNGY